MSIRKSACQSYPSLSNIGLGFYIRNIRFTARNDEGRSNVKEVTNNGDLHAVRVSPCARVVLFAEVACLKSVTCNRQGQGFAEARC
jgi:hypothetical protein